MISGSVRLRAGARDDLVNALRTMMAASMAEPGCRTYRCTFDLVDPDLLHFHEEWDDEASLSAHFVEPHFMAFNTMLAEHTAGAGVFTRHDVRASRPLF
ncbi:MAG: putative quinol monooxygenase [Actinomycetota bacterium]